jgi:hypothetical protein
MLRLGREFAPRDLLEEGAAAPFWGSVHGAGRRAVATGVHEAAQDCRAVEIAVGCEFVDARGALESGVFSVVFEHQIGGAPYIDLGAQEEGSVMGGGPRLRLPSPRLIGCAKTRRIMANRKR